MACFAIINSVLLNLLCLWILLKAAFFYFIFYFVPIVFNVLCVFVLFQKASNQLGFFYIFVCLFVCLLVCVFLGQAFQRQ